MENISDEYEIARLDNGRLRDLVLLHEATYGTRPAADYYSRKYDTGFTGVRYAGYIAYDAHGKPVSHYGVAPCFLADGDAVVLAAQGIDAMTHPAHQRRGLFIKLAKMTLALCRSEGVELVFGFANQNSFPGLIRRLDWHTTGPLDRFTIQVAASLPPRVFRRAGWARPIYTRYVERTLGSRRLDLKGLPNACLEEGWGGVQRDGRFFDYKTYSPTHVIRVGAGCAWVRIDHELMIGDLSVSEADFDHAMTVLRNLAARLGLRTMTCQLSPGTRLHRMFARRFPARPSLWTVFGDLGTRLSIDNLKFTYADLDIF